MGKDVSLYTAAAVDGDSVPPPVNFTYVPYVPRKTTFGSSIKNRERLHEPVSFWQVILSAVLNGDFVPNGDCVRGMSVRRRDFSGTFRFVHVSNYSKTNVGL